nr:MAG TPA: resistance protein [Caudoviricetes sp.]
MSSIYELNKNYMEVAAMLEEAETPEEIEAIQNTLEMLDFSIEEKIENTAMYMVNAESDIQGLKNEIDRLTKIKKAKENAVEHLKNNVEYAMKQKGLDALTVGTFKCGYRKSESVEIINLDVIPADFTKVEIKADKTAIKKALKAGEVVEGAEIKVNQNFYIK